MLQLCVQWVIWVPGPSPRHVATLAENNVADRKGGGVHFEPTTTENFDVTGCFEDENQPSNREAKSFLTAAPWDGTVSTGLLQRPLGSGLGLFTCRAAWGPVHGGKMDTQLFHLYRILTSYFHLTFHHFSGINISYFTTGLTDFRVLFK